MDYVSHTTSKGDKPLDPLLTGKRESSAKFDLSVPLKPYVSENAEYEQLLVIECRGLEFIDFDPKVFFH